MGLDQKQVFLCITSDMRAPRAATSGDDDDDDDHKSDDGSAHAYVCNDNYGNDDDGEPTTMTIR